MHNQRIRKEARLYDVKLWQIADRLGLNDGNFSRKLRRELPDDEQEMIVMLIHEIAGEAANAAD